MKIQKHLFLSLRKRDFYLDLQLPLHQFPPKFIFKNEKFTCGGYFTAYNKNISPEQLTQLCLNNEWREIANLIGDFIIIFCNHETQELYIITDQTGKFPCFFSVTPETLLFSTDFYQLLKTIPSATLNVESALEYISRSTFITDKTIIREIQQIPPATLFKFDNHSVSLIPLIDSIEFFNNLPKIKYPSIKNFAETFLHNLSELVAERFKKVAQFKYCADISSGFDCSLVCYILKQLSSKPFICYSMIARQAFSDTDPQLVTQFAQKHQMPVHFVSYDEIFPFSTPFDLLLIKQRPSQIVEYQLYKYLTAISSEGNIIRFTGDGGDETYWLNRKALEMNLKFPLHQEYFLTIETLKWGIDKILSKKGTATLIDQDRFREKKVYPLLISPSAVDIHLQTFFLSWQTNTWPISPFADPRLLSLVNSIPHKENRFFSKQEIWKQKPDIFPLSYFRPKGGPDQQFNRYLMEKTDFILTVLNNSILGQLGLVRDAEIIKNIKEGNLRQYLDRDTPSYLLNLIRLEYFLQKNQVQAKI